MLTGFMGVGKTTIGQQIASRLKRDFIDVDHEIVRRNNMPVTEIFRTMGEPAFRQMEREIILDLCRNARMKVVSLGGGAYMQEEIRTVCLSEAIVVHLHLSWEAWQKRLPLLLESRPLLQQRPLEEVERLYRSRLQAYSQNHVQIDTDGLSPEEAAETAVQTLRDKFLAPGGPV